MKDAIFYTFSTIPQVLAGAIALIGVFAIFKINEIKKELDGQAQNFYDYIKDFYIGVKKPSDNLDFKWSPIFDRITNSLVKAKVSRNYMWISQEMNEFFELHKPYMWEINGLEPILKEIEKRFNIYYENRNKLKKDTINVITFSAILISIIVILIPIGVVDKWWLGIPLLICSFLALGINLYLIVKIIKDSL